jgi:phage FluMu protein Com
MITRQTETTRVVTDDSIRCTRCLKLLAERATRPWLIRCVRCGHANTGGLRDAAAARPEAEQPPPIAPSPATTPPKPKPKRRRRKKAT